MVFSGAVDSTKSDQQAIGYQATVEIDSRKFGWFTYANIERLSNTYMNHRATSFGPQTARKSQ